MTTVAWPLHVYMHPHLSLLFCFAALRSRLQSVKEQFGEAEAGSHAASSMAEKPTKRNILSVDRRSVCLYVLHVQVQVQVRVRMCVCE